MATKQCGSCSLRASEISSCVCTKIGYCSIECQKQDWRSHKKDCPAYTRKPVNGKGYGLVATRNIKAGNQVGVCRDVIIVPNWLSDFETVSRIMQEFTNLSEEDEELLMTLNDKGEDYEPECNPLNCSGLMLEGLYRKYGGMERVRKVVRVYWHNRSSSERGGNMRMYLPQVFMNHSCSPNATVTFNENGEITILALIDIKKGKEIVESYFPPEDEFELQMNEKKERIESIKKYGFTCCCNICLLTGEEWLQNDQIRRDIKTGYKKLMEVNALCNRGIKTNANYLEIAEDLVDSLNKIPTEMIDGLKERLMACYRISSLVVLEGKLPRVEPKVYKAQLYQIIKGYGPLMTRNTDEVVHQTRDELRAKGGGKYLHMF